MSDQYKLWGGRFSEPLDALMERFNASVRFDVRLFAQDVKASQAHAAMLAKQGIITQDEAQAISQGLEQVAGEIARGELAPNDAMEDVHTMVEGRLKEIIGQAAGKLHTARSRNDQVATDLRLWVLDAGAKLDNALMAYQRALVELAENNADVIMPGYTHLQRAQPVLLAHHLLAYVEMAWRDRSRLADCLGRAATLPLGAAALAGTTFPVDPKAVAAELGFTKTAANSLDAVSDRDFAAEFLFVLALTQVHLSRLAEELVLWSSQEFGFISLPESFTTGSSIMPQKKNPDAAELIRGKTGRVTGNLVALFTMLKGLPLAYNKDMQEDKEPVFDSFDTVHDSLRVMAPMLGGARMNPERMALAVKGGYLEATEVADYLANKGVPFRQAHEIAGRAVKLAEESGRGLSELTLEEYQELSHKIGGDLFEVIDPRRAVDRRQSPGGTGGENVKAALKEARERLWPK